MAGAQRTKERTQAAAIIIPAILVVLLTGCDNPSQTESSLAVLELSQHRFIRPLAGQTDTHDLKPDSWILAISQDRGISHHMSIRPSGHASLFGQRVLCHTCKEATSAKSDKTGQHNGPQSDRRERPSASTQVAITPAVSLSMELTDANSRESNLDPNNGCGVTETRSVQKLMACRATRHPDGHITYDCRAPTSHHQHDLRIGPGESTVGVHLYWPSSSTIGIEGYVALIGGCQDAYLLPLLEWRSGSESRLGRLFSGRPLSHSHSLIVRRVNM
ncbi:hypothetical protein EYF80_020978 [Liparis tanakae]|uniref:Uncharacterized protein n=1 Tax=Liparis tanakae TaxID=230148 RepID=A0A4Z2HT11_9TELE|nr:hypothetical protein EYF80_020978 [Liparis tanakae]